MRSQAGALFVTHIVLLISLDWSGQLRQRLGRSVEPTEGGIVESWVTEEFASLDLGDARLNKRCRRIMDQLSEKPALSIPAACGGWAETHAAYRFFNHESVTSKEILKPHFEATVCRAAEHPVVLVPQDTTTLNLTRPRERMTGVGPLSDESNHGIFDHVALAVTPSGVPLGVVYEEMWARDWEIFYANKKLTRSEKAVLKRSIPIEDKESGRWLRGYRQGSELQARCPGTQVIVISDSEADILDCFAEAQVLSAAGRPAADWITRAFQDRRLARDSAAAKLWSACSEASVLGEIEVQVHHNQPSSGDKTKRNQARTARQTRVTIQATTVTLAGQPRGDDDPVPDVTVNAVLVREVSPPAGEKPLEWLLLTSLPIDTVEAAALVVTYYSRRWSIETYFHILKSGCGIEELQFETLDRYKRCLAVYMVVAWRVYFVTMLGRECPELPCEAVFTKEEWQACYAIHRKTPMTIPTLKEMVSLVGQLGGYLARKGDGPPGPQTIWIGLQRLRDFALAWETFGPGQAKPGG